ncbi:MAG: hypothetical protein IPH08_05025 [Rhodocyclaceae bacterium]|nr:hypothetical protein [Rhodocyclaceae bacterium]MBK6906485.1 hypothetical protein [Rhodocyclaceae bacterium]
MFDVLEKNGALMPVHSLADLKHLMARGWKQQTKPEVPAPTQPQPKKRGRPAKKG